MSDPIQTAQDAPAAVKIEHYKLVGGCDPWFEAAGRRVSLADASDRDLAYAMGAGGAHIESVAAEWRRRYPEAPVGAKWWAQAAHAAAARLTRSGEPGLASPVDVG